MDLCAYGIVGHHQFKYAGAALVAGLAAFGATRALAMRADLAYQALRQHAQ